MAASWLQWIARLTHPELARAMERQGTALGDSGVADAEVIAVEDNGADVTLVCFAGMAALYAGLPQFEFQKLLRSEGRQFNYVFVRDCRRMMYLEKPDGSPGGVDYYLERLAVALSSLGTRCNIALGASGGGGIAVYFATRLGMHHAIAFSPGFPPTHQVEYVSLRNFLKHFGKVRAMWREPAGWLESMLMMSAASLLQYKIERRLGKNCWPDMLGAFIESESKPGLTLIIGKDSTADNAQACLLEQYRGVEVIRLDTARHHTPGVLKKEGRLKSTLDAALEKALSEKAPKTPLRAFDGTQEKEVVS